jgi:uracil-DNA glycosylase family 4
MAESDREELLALLRGFSVYLESARDSGALVFGRRDETLGSVTGSPRSPDPHATPAAAASHERTSPEPTAPEPMAPPRGATDPARNSPQPRAGALPSSETARALVTEAADLEEDSPSVEPRRNPPSGLIATGAERPRSNAQRVGSLLDSLAADRAVDYAPMNSTARLRVLEDGAARVRDCTRCKLCEGRRNTVYARGRTDATVMFVGEAPGADEDEQGVPFVGVSGQLLDRIIAAMGLTQDEIYVANVVKCRPPNNRPPEPDEILACGAYLLEQIDAVKPRVLVSLGRTPSAFLLRSSETMTRMRGSWHEFRGIPLRATWHPSYLLRNPESKRETWADMRQVMARLGRAVSARPTETEDTE